MMTIIDDQIELLFLKLEKAIRPNNFLLCKLKEKKYFFLKMGRGGGKKFNLVRILDAVLFSSSVPVGGPSPPFYMANLHKEDKRWVSLGLPFSRRTKVGFHLGCHS